MTEQAVQTRSTQSRFVFEETATKGKAPRLSMSDCPLPTRQKSPWPEGEGTRQPILTSHAASTHIKAPLRLVWGALTSVEFWKKAYAFEEVCPIETQIRSGYGLSGKRQGRSGSFIDRLEFQSVKEGIVIQYFLWSSEFRNATPHLVTLTLRDSWENTRLSALEAWPSDEESGGVPPVNPWEERLLRIKREIEGE
jgi:hypothetical protein